MLHPPSPAFAPIVDGIVRDGSVKCCHKFAHPVKSTIFGTYNLEGLLFQIFDGSNLRCLCFHIFQQIQDGRHPRLKMDTP